MVSFLIIKIVFSTSDHNLCKHNHNPKKTINVFSNLLFNNWNLFYKQTQFVQTLITTKNKNLIFKNNWIFFTSNHNLCTHDHNPKKKNHKTKKPNWFKK